MSHDDKKDLQTRLEVDRWVDQFEVQLRSRNEPDIESFLAQVDSSLREPVREEISRIVSQPGRSSSKESQLESSDIESGGDFSVDSEIDNSELAGRVIGPYKLLQVIGEGGMGTVYMAEQQSPVRRRVALKIIKLGMDTREVIARFEVERQALAMLDHPNIAKVLDVGSTDSGRPYFAMELVKGLPITRYCDDRKLSLDQRLKLFKSVCFGIQHAHQRGIIHRDLKPSNILVAEYDHEVVPKIIDFGLAKAMNQRLTDKTMFTQLGQVVGTLSYMSPEQSKMNQLDVDTRTDIYSLGVILYEILTGATPFDRNRMKSEAIDQILRIIREEDPPAPSMRVSTIESMPQVAASRQLEPKRMQGILNGELDWIVMKALDKERSRRYESASSFAIDIERYLTGDPVEAAPPGAAYRLKKFVRRNRAKVIASTLVLLALVFGIIGTTIGLFQANRARHEAVIAKEDAEQRRLATREALDLMSGTMLDEWLLAQSEVSEDHRAFLLKVLEYYEDFADDSGNGYDNRMLVAKACQRVGNINDALGQTEEAISAYSKSKTVLESIDPSDQGLDEFQLAKAETLALLGQTHKRTGKRDSAMEFYEQASTIFERLAKESPDSFELQHRNARQRFLVARLLIADQKETQAIPILEELVNTWKSLLVQFKHQHRTIQLSLASTLQSLALRYRFDGQEGRAIATYEEAIQVLEMQVDQNPQDRNSRWQLSVVVNDLGVLHKSKKRYQVAEPMYARALSIRKSLHSENPNSTEYATLLGGSYLNLGNLCRILKRDEEASRHYRAGIAICSEVLERDPADVRPRRYLRNLYEGLAESQVLAREYTAALKSWNESIKNNAAEFSLNDRSFDMRLPLRKAYVLAKLNRVATALSLTEKTLEQTGKKELGEAWYCAASVYCAAFEVETNPDQKEKHAAKAVELLKASVEIGEAWSGPKGTQWKTDIEFEPIRYREDFKAISEKDGN